MNMGKKYKKAMYVQYTDDTYSTKVPHDPNLGSMGPTIRAEVGLICAMSLPFIHTGALIRIVNTLYKPLQSLACLTSGVLCL